MMTYNKQQYLQNNKTGVQQEEYLTSDKELAALAGNDMSSFDELYRRHYRRVYCICLRMTRNVADAEDITQDVFIQLQRSIGSYRGESSFVSWLHRIAVNQVLMRFRKKSTKCELTTEDGEMPDTVIPTTANPQQMPIIDNIALATAISKLPQGYRNVFLLHDVEGYEHEEIGTMLGISSGTSKSQLHKARLKLRKLLQECNVSATDEINEVAAVNAIKPARVANIIAMPLGNNELELLAA